MGGLEDDVSDAGVASSFKATIIAAVEGVISEGVLMGVAEVGAAIPSDHER